MSSRPKFIKPKPPNDGNMDRAKALFVVVTPPLENDPDKVLAGVHIIVLDAGKFVFIPTTAEMLGIDGVVQVTDDRCEGVDTDGHSLGSIPEEWCSFLTEAQAESIADAIQTQNAVKGSQESNP